MTNARPTSPASPSRRPSFSRPPSGAWPAPLGLLAASMLSGCAALWPAAEPALTPAPLNVAPLGWQAPLPHEGNVSELSRWWQQFDDALLPPLIEAAQAVSPSVATAASRIEQSRAQQVAAQAASWPGVNASAAISRGQPDLSTPLGNSASAGVQAGWEIDLFGAVKAGRDAAAARLDLASVGWHEARVSVAAEVAAQYIALRACEAQLAQARLDADSRAETARLTEAAARAGFQAPANAALARASAAQGNSQWVLQRSQCERGVKALVALTGIDEASLRGRLAPGAQRLPQPAQLGVSRVPAEALAQRPDLYAAEREVLATASELDQSQALRRPRISLGGSIGVARFSSGAGTLDGNVWQIGPLSVSLPLFDGGVRAANVVAARARHEEARMLYGARLRQAVREVEDALIVLQGTAERSADAQLATEGFAASFTAVQARHRAGLASLFELEDARRSALQAQSALIELQRERIGAWIALYRALGGGWSAQDLQVDAQPVARRSTPAVH